MRSYRGKEQKGGTLVSVVKVDKRDDNEDYPGISRKYGYEEYKQTADYTGSTVS